MTLSSVGVWLSIAGQAHWEKAAIAVRHAVTECAQTARAFEAARGGRVLLVPEEAIHRAAGIPACAADRVLPGYCHG